MEKNKIGKSGKGQISAPHNFLSKPLVALPFPKPQILDSSKPKEFADSNFELSKYGRKFSECVEKTVGNGEIARYEQFLLSHSVFKSLVLQTHKKPGLVWERVNSLPHNHDF